MATDQWSNNSGFPLNQAQVCHQTHLDVQRAYDYPHFSSVLRRWEELNESGTLPCKEDFSPFHIEVHLLPFILLIDVLRDPVRFQYRLTGTKLDRIHNVNLTGTFVSEMVPEPVRADLETDLMAIIAAMKPQFVQLDFTNRTGNHRDFKVLRIPLRANESDVNQVDHVLVLTDAD